MAAGHADDARGRRPTRPTAPCMSLHFLSLKSQTGSTYFPLNLQSIFHTCSMHVASMFPILHPLSILFPVIPSFSIARQFPIDCPSIFHPPPSALPFISAQHPLHHLQQPMSAMMQVMRGMLSTTGTYDSAGRCYKNRQNRLNKSAKPSPQIFMRSAQALR